MPKAGLKQRTLVVAVGAILLAACARNVSKEEMAKATEGYVEDTNKLFVVDCLLPGQVRKMGTQMTYLSARRPVRTTAADCEVRGGEYVAYDRANYASAFKVWLPRAKDGDPEAQNIVGQIFEKGLGQPADYKAAFDWYKKSAEQGNGEAQLNLGHLYEKGLGTSADMEAANKWYRKASGLDTAGLQFTPAVGDTRMAAAQPAIQPIAQTQPVAQTDNKELESLRREAEASRREAEQSRQEAVQARAQLADAQGKIIEQQEALRRSQDETEATRMKIQEEKASPAKTDDTALRQLEAELRQKEEQLKAQQSRLASMTESLTDTDKMREEADRSRLEASQLRGELAETKQQLASQQDALSRSRDELAETQRKIQQEKAQPAKADDSALRQLEDELRQRQAQLKSQEAKVAAMSASVNKDRQSVKREREAVRQEKVAAAPRVEAPQVKASSGERGELAQSQTALNDKIIGYQRKSGELTQMLTSGGADRSQIDARKQELQADAKEIAALREKVGQQNRKLADSGQESLKLAEGPKIEIIDPPIPLTRGMPTIQVNSGDKRKEIVGRINSPDGLSGLTVNDQPQTVDASGVFRIPVNFSGGQTQINIAATDKKNRKVDLVVSLVGEADEAKTEALPQSKQTGSVSPGDVNFGQFYALIIGNADYKAYPGLKTPINDAKSVELILRERYGFKTTLLVNANRHAIMSALNEMKKKLTEQDNLLVYYAGHGEIDKNNQNAYWLPTDAEVGNTANWISSANITEFLSIVPARHVIVVADSCYSGAMTGSAVAKLPDGMDQSKREKWLKVMNSRKARTVLTSGGVKPVMDAGGGDHSIFADAFLKVLRSNKGVIEDYELYRDVSNEMRPASVKVGFQQTPQYAPLQHAGHEGSPFFFVPEA